MKVGGSGHPSAVPRAAGEFLGRYLPEWLSAQVPGLSGSSSGSVAVVIRDRDERYSLRLVDGRLCCTPGMAPDTLWWVSVTQSDFELFLVGALERRQERPASGTRLGLLLQLLLPRATAPTSGRVPNGSTEVCLRDGTRRHEIRFGPGSTRPEGEPPICRVTLELTDYLELEAGKVAPLELLMSGKILIEGEAQVLLSLIG